MGAAPAPVVAAAAAKPKKKKKIVIEEVDSSVAEEAAPAPVVAAAAKPKHKKKNIVIEEVDSSSPPVPEAPSSPTPKMPAAFKFKLQAPRTGYEFERKLSALHEASAICQYLDLVKVNSVRKLLSQDLSVEILMKVCEGLANSELQGGLPSHVKLLDVLSKVNRFDIILDFLSQEEKSQVEAAFVKLKNVEGVDRVRQEYNFE